MANESKDADNNNGKEKSKDKEKNKDAEELHCDEVDLFRDTELRYLGNVNFL